jgi:hypothetical protein
MDTAGQPGGDLVDVDRFRLFRHGQPPDSSASFPAALSLVQLTFFFRTRQPLFFTWADQRQVINRNQKR